MRRKEFVHPQSDLQRDVFLENLAIVTDGSGVLAAVSGIVEDFHGITWRRK